MRKIKFRVFDTKYNCYAWDKGDWSLGVNSGMVRGIYGERFPEMTVEQFTGLKDKNGKEVYEGDIIDAKGTVVTVKWEESDLTYLIWHEDHQEWYSLSFLKGLKDFEVIGNIHENQELLSQVK